MPADNVPHRGRHQEILLAQAQALALQVVVVGIQHLADGLPHGALTHGPHVVPLVEPLHVKAGALGPPQAEHIDPVAAVTGNVHVVGNRQHRGVAGVLHQVDAAVPPLLDLPAKADLHRVLRHRLQPDLPAGEPVVGAFGLPAVDDLLPEDAVLV